MTNVYVAGSSLELERAQAAIAVVRAAGGHITYDWTRGVATARAEGLTDSTVPQSFAEAQAEACLAGIDEADAIVFLVPSDASPSRGAWIEIGYAVAGGKPVIACGPNARASIFLRTFCIAAATDDEGAARAATGGDRMAAAIIVLELATIFATAAARLAGDDRTALAILLVGWLACVVLTISDPASCEYTGKDDET